MFFPSYSKSCELNSRLRHWLTKISFADTSGAVTFGPDYDERRSLKYILRCFRTNKSRGYFSVIFVKFCDCSHNPRTTIKDYRNPNFVWQTASIGGMINWKFMPWPRSAGRGRKSCDLDERFAKTAAAPGRIYSPIFNTAPWDKSHLACTISVPGRSVITYAALIYEEQLENRGRKTEVFSEGV